MNLRNGLAAENAFALMREKGLLNPRKSRHRLTPGTVKFAAFHVLSLEGSEGLTLIELADKSQVSFFSSMACSAIQFTCSKIFLCYRNPDFGTSQQAGLQRRLYLLL